jgi:tetratricopeptide (TPR) repeat protein
MRVLAVAMSVLAAPALAASPQEKARDLLAEARTMAGEDRHGKAIACALAAIELDPSLEGEAALLLAHQYLWSDRPAEAIPWYGRHLADHPLDLEARLGLARALSWSDRLEDSRRIYENVAGEHPENVEAWAGLARVASWSGDDREAERLARETLARDPANREARAILAAVQNRRGKNRAAENIYNQLLEEEPGDVESRVGRARARFWMGEGQRALEDLEGIESREGVELRRAIVESNRGSAEAGYSSYVDVDDQEVETVFAAAGFAPDIASRVEIYARRADTREPGTDDVGLLRFSAGGWRQFSRSWALHAYAGMGRIEAEGDVPAGEGETIAADDAERDLFLADAWITWMPVDWTRFDAGAARIPIETPKALARGIAIHFFSLSANRRFHDRVAVEAAGSYGDYTDDNSRVAGGLSLEFRPVLSLPLRLEAGASAFTFDRTLDHGYYNPEDYNALFAGAIYAADLGERIHLELNGRLSTEQENDEDRFGVGAGGIDALIRLHRSIALSGFARKTTSRFDTGAGYGREGWGAALRWSP